LPREVKIVRDENWSAFDPSDEKLAIATTRILRLREAGLTIEMIGADFLRRRIAPLQDKGRPAWQFVNAADVMRLRPGMDHNLTIMQHGSLMQKLFGSATAAPLPKDVVPLCNNSRLSRILAMMPALDAHSVDERWAVPSDDLVQQFFNNLSEKAIHDNENLVAATTPREMAYIASRAKEAGLADEVGGSGVAGEESSDEEEEEGAAGQNVPVEEQVDTFAEDHPVEETEEEETEEEAPTLKPTSRRVLRNSATGIPVRQASSSGPAPDKEAAGKEPQRQEVCRQPSPAATKRARSHSPPPRTSTMAEVTFDFSAISSGEDEE
jgi:hypothetical protein